MLRTRLQVASGMSYDQFIRYLDWMTERGLAAIVPLPDGHEGAVITEKGRDAYVRMMRWMNDFVHQRA